MRKLKAKKKPVIPEPSPRFVLWSAIAAVALIVGVITFEYSADVWGAHKATATTHLAKDQKDKT